MRLCCRAPLELKITALAFPGGGPGGRLGRPIKGGDAVPVKMCLIGITSNSIETIRHMPSPINIKVAVSGAPRGTAERCRTRQSVPTRQRFEFNGNLHGAKWKRLTHARRKAKYQRKDRRHIRKYNIPPI